MLTTTFLLCFCRICDSKGMENICLYKGDKLWSFSISRTINLQPVEMDGRWLFYSHSYWKSIIFIRNRFVFIFQLEYKKSDSVSNVMSFKILNTMITFWNYILSNKITVVVKCKIRVWSAKITYWYLEGAQGSVLEKNWE